MATFEVLDELMEITGSTELHKRLRFWFVQEIAEKEGLLKFLRGRCDDLRRKNVRRRMLIREIEALGERGVAVEAGEEENALLLRNTGERLSSQEEYNRRVDERKEQEQQRKLFQETVIYKHKNGHNLWKGIEAAFAYPVTLEKRLKMLCSRFMKYMVMLGTAETLRYGFAFYDNNASVYHVVSICSKDWHYTRMSLHENGTSWRSEVDLMGRARGMYQDENRNSPFNHEKAWAILGQHAKWDAPEVAPVDLTKDETGDFHATVNTDELFGADPRPRPRQTTSPKIPNPKLGVHGRSHSSQFGEFVSHELRLKREAAEKAFEASKDKDETIKSLEELRFLALSTKDLSDDDAFWILRKKKSNQSQVTRRNADGTE
ncbi:hypothetical protein Tco_0410190 [Tanacetum coccineum]